MKSTMIFLSILFAFVIGCKPSGSQNENKLSEPETKSSDDYFEFKSEFIFPNSQELIRPEDGVALSNGNLIVSDQANGLRLIEPSGVTRKFGDFASVGYSDVPVENRTAPNGVFLEKNGEYILISDLSDGKIYRINVNTEEVSMIYDHPYGVNTVYRDQTGAIWFTQSTRSTNMVELFRDINNLVPHGSVFRMASLESEPVEVIDSLYLANGLTMDMEEKHLYVAETMMDRVHDYEVDVQSGTVEYKGVVAHVGTPDNIMMDSKGRLIAASPIYNQVVLFDLDKRSSQILFDGSTLENSKLSNEWTRRSHLGIPRGDLLTADMFYPLPGLITGMFLSPDEKTLYITNLGVDLVKLDLN